MITSHPLTIILPAAALLLTAVLKIASRAVGRRELHRWARRTLGDDADEGSSWEHISETFTSIRLARQLSLVFVVVMISNLGPGWIGTPTDGHLAWSMVLALGGYLLIDKLLPFTIVTMVGPIRVLKVGRPVIAVLHILFGSPARMLNNFQHGSRVREDPMEDVPEEGDLDAFIDMAEESGLVSEHDEALLRGVAEFSEVLVDHVMTPRVDIVSINESATLGALSSLVAEHKHSRIPVVQDNIDQVVGIVNIRELVAALERDGAEALVRNIVRPAMFVPERKRVSALMREFQQRHEHLAIVVDEHGGTAGLVTIEDLLEEIVGEIQDEVEDAEQTLVKLSDETVIATGKTEIEAVEKMFGISIDANDFETVGGMAFLHFGYVPKPGESFEHSSLHVQVLEADDRHVDRVRITSVQPVAE